MKKKQQGLKKHSPTFISWEVFVILVITLISNGLFNENQIMVSALAISMVLLLSIVYRLLKRTETISLSIISIACFVIACSYIPSFWHSSSTEYTITKIIEWCTYACVLLLIPALYYKYASKIIVSFTFIFSFFHFLILYGIIPLSNGVFILNDDFSGGGIRLAGFLQYPNATAAIFATLILYSLMHFIDSQEKRVFQISQLTALFISSYLLLMTESRGAWFLFALCFFFSLFIVKRQLTYIIYMGAIMFFAVISYSLTSIFGVNRIGTIIGILILASSIGLSFYLQKQILKITFQMKSKWILPISMPILLVMLSTVLFILNLLPNALKQRLTQNTATLSDRFVYMKDGWHAILDHFLFGSGGEAWRYNMYEFQSAPYVVQDLHMFYLQHWLEVGFIGFILFVIGLLAALFMVGKKQPRLLPPIFMLLGHSLIDFTLSYGFTILLLACLLVEGFGEKGFITLKKQSAKYTYTGLTALFTIFLIIPVAVWVQAENLYKDGLAVHNVQLIEQAIQKNPFASRYALAKYELISDEKEQIKTLQQALKYEPTHSLMLFQLASKQVKIKNYETAFHNYKKSLQYDRFDRQKYEMIIDDLSSLESKDNQIQDAARNLSLTVQKQLLEYEKLAQQSTIRDQREFLN